MTNTIDAASTTVNATASTSASTEYAAQTSQPPTELIQTAPVSNLPELSIADATGEAPNNELDQDAFLKLLVAQLRYQDPLDPSDPADFMATTAQFTTIEKLDQIAEQGANAAILSGLSTASSLVGRAITFLDANDQPQTAVVRAAQVAASGVQLVTELGPVDMANLIAVGEVGFDPSATPAPDEALTDEAITDDTLTDEPVSEEINTDQPASTEPASTEPASTEPVTTAAGTDVSSAFDTDGPAGGQAVASTDQLTSNRNEASA